MSTLEIIIEIGALATAVGAVEGFFLKLKNKLFGELKTRLMRLELLNYIQHMPEEKIAIAGLYKEYKESGGNGFIDLTYQNWQKQYMKGGE